MTDQRVQFDSGIDSDLRQEITELEPVFRHVMGKGYNRANLRWERPDPEEDVVRLEISSGDISESGDFEMDELSDSRATRIRLFRIWDRVLAREIQRQLQRVQESMIENGEPVLA